MRSDVNNVTMYQGTIKDIIEDLCKELGTALNMAGIRPTGIHVLAMMHLVAALAKANTEEPNQELGKMPSFKMLLGTLIRNYTRTAYSVEETEAFKDEFLDIMRSIGMVEDLGPRPTQSQITQKVPFMAPMSKEVH